MRAMRTLSVKLPAALEARLAALAQRRGVTKSAVIRRALEWTVSDDRGRGRAGSFLALAKDLAGSLAGPADLSYNKRRLRGYGR